MEFIKNVAQFEKMIDNKIIGMPELIDSQINFRGKNNILFCDNNIKLSNVILDFNGDNSIVYLSSSLNDSFKLEIYSNSTLFLGRDIKFGHSVSIFVHESQNIIIGDDCFINSNTNILTSDSFPFYNIKNKQRRNFSHSIFIGDHVYVGGSALISRGTRIGSGAIIGDCTFVPPLVSIPSNVHVLGNPAKIIGKDVFFTKDFLGSFTAEDSINSKDYFSDVFIYEFSNRESLDMDYIDDILNDLDVTDRLDFIQKLFVRNRRKNRFAIKN